MNIIEYEEKYRKSVCQLFEQLQCYLVDIDPEHVQMMTEAYSNKYCDYVLTLLKHNFGKMYLAEDDGKIIGLVAGHIEEKDEEDKLTTRCPKRGVISELVVDRVYRNNGVGSLLMDFIEGYFKEQNCEYIVVNVFKPNESAYQFYKCKNYNSRNIEMIKHCSDVTKKSHSLKNITDSGLIKIRQAKPYDLKAVAEIKVTGWQSAYKGIVADEYLNSMTISEQIDRIKKYSLETIFVAEIDNEILGFCRFYDYDKPIYEDKEIDCEIREIYVRPELKRNGIGRALFEHTKQYFRQKGKKKLYLGCLQNNYNARYFYEKMGGISKVSEDIIIGDKNYSCVAYVYDL